MSDARRQLAKDFIEDHGDKLVAAGAAAAGGDWEKMLGILASFGYAVEKMVRADAPADVHVDVATHHDDRTT